MNSAIYYAYLDSGANQLGGDLPFFVGKQYGSGWLSTLAKVAFPILKRLAGVATGVAANVAHDVIYNERPIGEAVKEHALKAGGTLAEHAIDVATTAATKFAKPQSGSSTINSSTPNRKKSLKRLSSTASYPFFNKKFRRS
jgi:hypothetical protein